MAECLFVTDLHGRRDRYEKLFALIRRERPPAVFLGGDLLSRHPAQGVVGADPGAEGGGFVEGFLARGFESLREALGDRYPRVFVILGNDDPRFEEAAFVGIEARGLWTYTHGRRAVLDDLDVYGYSCIPPSPFALKDWERYDVSRYVDPGCTPPTEGYRTVPDRSGQAALGTILEDLQRLIGGRSLERAILLCHCPPYRTLLDRAALDGVSIDHVPLDVHIGSIAIRRFIEARQPLLTLHGHVHESTRLTGCWRDRLGLTHSFNAAHDGPELAVIAFDTDRPDQASRTLL